MTREVHGDLLGLWVSRAGQGLDEQMYDRGPRVGEVPLLARVGQGRRYTPGVVEHTLALQV